MIKLLIILVLVLAIIAIVQLTKVYNLTHRLRQTKEEEITHADNKMNAWLWMVWMVILFTSTIYLYLRYGNYLPEPASEHGVDVDKLMSFNIWVITIAYFAMNGGLFWVCYKYYYRKDRKAWFQVHDNRLEMLWTMLPGIFMAIVIIYGLITWNKITGPASDKAMRIEIYSKQFNWAMRYPGNDKVFGTANVNMIGVGNEMGIITYEGMKARLDEIDASINKYRDSINTHHDLMPGARIEAMEDQIYKWQRLKQRLLDLGEREEKGISAWVAGKDDIIVKELHMPVGEEIELLFTSQDVLHSAYMPHFRAQMNTVPGVPTRFKMKPTITTREMREKMNDPEFDYILLCNKVCGASHFNMQAKIVVETKQEYNAWLEQQKTFVAAVEPAAETTPPAPAETTTSAQPAATAQLAPVK